MAAQPPSPSPISFGSLFFIFLVSLPLLYCLSRTAAVAVGSCGVAGGGEVVAPPEPQPLPPASSCLFFSFPLPLVHTIACDTRRRRSSDDRGWQPEEVVRQRRRGASRQRARAAGVARGTVEGNRGGAPCIFTRCRSAGELTARPCSSASHRRRSFRVRLRPFRVRVSLPIQNRFIFSFPDSRFDENLDLGLGCT
jgi:hypothetical protein